MLEKIASYDMNPEILKVPGEVQAGEEHDEFHVDDCQSAGDDHQYFLQRSRIIGDMNESDF